MATFSGTLTQNEIYSALYNMIISQEVFADRISDGSELVDKAKVDGGLYGDTKLYYSADVLHSYDWANDAEASNLLDVSRAKAPECQAIKLDQFRQITLTLDSYLSKRAFSDEGAFGQFNSVMESMIGKSKRIHDVTTYNAYVGTAETDIGAQSAEVVVADTETPETEAKLIAEKVANIMVEMKDVSRDYNDYAQVTKFSEGQIKVIWNSKHVNKIRKVDLPAIFHMEGLMDKFGEEVLPARYFGTVVTSPVTVQNNDGTYRTLIEKAYTVSGVLHELFPGDLIPAGVAIAANEAYKEDDSIVCKIVVKLPPFMSAFEVGTSFFNPRSLTTNRYLTWGRNTLEYFKAYPMVTLRKVAE